MTDNVSPLRLPAGSDGIAALTRELAGLIVTALNLDIGSRVWWPSRLARAAEPETDLSGELETVGAGTG